MPPSSHHLQGPPPPRPSPQGTHRSPDPPPPPVPTAIVAVPVGLRLLSGSAHQASLPFLPRVVPSLVHNAGPSFRHIGFRTEDGWSKPTIIDCHQVNELLIL